MNKKTNRLLKDIDFRRVRVVGSKSHRGTTPEENQRNREQILAKYKLMLSCSREVGKIIKESDSPVLTAEDSERIHRMVAQVW